MKKTAKQLFEELGYKQVDKEDLEVDENIRYEYTKTYKMRGITELWYITYNKKIHFMKNKNYYIEAFKEDTEVENIATGEYTRKDFIKKVRIRNGSFTPEITKAELRAINRQIEELKWNKKTKSKTNKKN